MIRVRFLLRATTSLAFIFAALSARAYNLGGQRWNTTSVVMQLQLGASSGTLIDGSTSWGVSAEDALGLWNNVVTNVKFTVVRDSTAAKADGNRLNNVFFSSTIYGDAWDSRTLAITLSTYNPTTRGFIETDVLFNTAISWNSYRGPLRTASGGGTLQDFHRVALHEFGHALGLDHPDELGQSVSAVMNSTSSNVDALTTDDINGVRAIYDTAAIAPTITTQPTSRSVAVGASTTFTVVATGTAPLTYQWYKSGSILSGATSASLTLSNVTTASAGNYIVIVSNSAGSVTSSTAVLTVATAVAPTISVQPASQTVTAGSSVTFSVTAAGSTPLSYQWRKNSTNIAGATGASFTIGTTAASDAAAYSVVVSNSAGSITSSSATLTVNAAPTGPTSRLSNLSVRTTLAARQVVTVGFTMSGGSKSVLVRAVGPSLSTFGIADRMPDPSLKFYANGVLVDSNDDWAGSSSVANTASAVGAFPFVSSTSFDAALVRSISGGNTVEVTGSPLASNPAATAGNVIVEVYDAISSTSPRLTNLSALNQVGTGSNLLIAGFTIAGTGMKNVLIRAVGPGLIPIGVSGVLADPKLELFNSDRVSIGSNDNYAANLAATFSSVGAFALPVGSKDAALVVNLAPGGYTVQVSGADGGTGIAIVELYELP